MTTHDAKIAEPVQNCATNDVRDLKTLPKHTSGNLFLRRKIWEKVRRIAIKPIKFLVWIFFRLIEKVFGVTIYRTLPRGVDPFCDLKILLPKWSPKVFFDVGANIGQSARIYSKRFPTSEILCFEPATKIYDELKQNMVPFPNVKCFNCAFSSEDGNGVLALNNHSDQSRLVVKSLSAAMSKSLNHEVVDQKTIDRFCEQFAICQIDYLKIDTEGADLAVLQGACKMLGKKLIGVIEVEVGVGLDNDLHVPLHQVKEYLESFGYLVFGFYEQDNEWKRRLPHLRRTNLVFISEHIDKAQSDI